MEQQTHQQQSVDTFNSEHIRGSSLLLGDPKQVGVIFLKSTLTRKLQELFSIAFRKIATGNHSISTSMANSRAKDCMKSIQHSDRRLPSREKSLTQRHLSSVQQMFDQLMCFSQDVKTVLNEINRYDRIIEIVGASKRIQQVVTLQRKRLQIIKNKQKFKDKSKIFDTEIAINCIQRLLKFIYDLSNGNEELMSLISEIQFLKSKIEINGKTIKQKQPKIKCDENSINRQTSKAVDLLVTIMKDHKIGNIKRKIEQESKKFNDVRKELFDGVLLSISKAQVFEQSNLSQITQLSSKLLQEQPTIQKNINHIQKQKRLFQKMLNECKGEQNKAAYYNLIDTSIYLVKLFNQKQGGNNDVSRIKSLSAQKPILSKSFTGAHTKQKVSATKSKTKDTKNIIQQSQSKIEQFSISKQQSILKLQLLSLVDDLTQIKHDMMNDSLKIDRHTTMNKYPNQDFRKIIQTIFDIIQFDQKQNQDIKSFIETLSFDIQNLRIKEQSLQQIIESKSERQKQYKRILSQITQLFSVEQCFDDYSLVIPKIQEYLLQNKLYDQQSDNKQQFKSESNELIQKCQQYLSKLSSSLPDIASIPQQLISTYPSLRNLQKQLSLIISQSSNLNQKYIQMQNKYSIDLKYQIQSTQYQIQNKCDEINYLKSNIQTLNSNIVSLKRQILESSKSVDLQSNDLRFQINLLKSQNNHNMRKYQEIIEGLEMEIKQCNMKNRLLGEKLENKALQMITEMQQIKEAHLNQKHSWEIQVQEVIKKYRQANNKNTTLQSNIFIYKREIESLKNEFLKVQSEVSKEEIVNSLKEQNAMLRTDVIEKGKMLYQLQVQKSPKALKGSVSGSLHNISSEETFKKINTNSTSHLSNQFIPLNQQSIQSTKQIALLEKQNNQMKQRLGVMNLHRSRDEGIIDELRKQIRIKDNQFIQRNYEIVNLKKDLDECKKIEQRLRERLKEYEVEEGSIIMKSTNDKWTNQLFLGTIDGHANKSTSNLSNLDDRALLLKKIDFLQGQLYSQGTKLIKNNNLRQQDLKILISENQLIQQQIRQINTKLIDEKIKHMISSKSLQDSLRKMQFQLAKLKQQATILKDQLKSTGNLEISYVDEIRKPTKSTYEFVTKKFSSKNIGRKEQISVPSSPRVNNNKFQYQLKQCEKQKQHLLSRVKLLSVFTIIDQQNKAFVHNINKVISGILQFLSTSDQFQECDYQDVDYITTLAQYLLNQDYQGYFQTIEVFFKDLFLNVFERKNTELLKQADQLIYMKDRMERLLTQKIDEIQEEQDRLSYSQRVPFKNYNEQKNSTLPQLQHLFKLFMRYKDPKVLKEVCSILNLNEQKQYY